MNSWNQPNDNEPSVGTLHLIYNAFLSSDPADTNYHEHDLSALIPVGTNAVILRVLCSSTTAGDYFTTSNANGGDNYVLARAQVGGVTNEAIGICPVTSTRTIWYKASNARITVGNIVIHGYYL